MIREVRLVAASVRVLLSELLPPPAVRSVLLRDDGEPVEGVLPMVCKCRM